MDVGRERSVPIPATVRLITSNPLLGELFKHFLEQRSAIDLQVDDLSRLAEPSALRLLDLGSLCPKRLAEGIERLPPQAPIALINASSELALSWVARYPGIRGVFSPQTSREQLLRGLDVLLAGQDWLSRPLMAYLVQRLRALQRPQALHQVGHQRPRQPVLAGKQHVETTQQLLAAGLRGEHATDAGITRDPAQGQFRRGIDKRDGRLRRQSFDAFGQALRAQAAEVQQT